MRTVVLGAGPAGCAAVLALARRGHDVTLIDRDEPPALGGAASAEQIFATWDRPGIGQFRQPHNFLGKGRAVLRDEFPDVYAALLAAGAGEIRQDAFLGAAPREPGDADLATIACRRPIVDATLRTAVAKQPGVTFHTGSVSGVMMRPPHVTGVRLTSGDELAADLVVDATGRNSAANRWTEEHGTPAWTEHTTDSKLLYYSRHYRFRDEPLPHASILGGPRGDVGYLAFAVFIGDNATFSLCVMAPAWEKDWRHLRDPEAFERVARELPGMAAWLDAAEPITHVLPMGQLHNTLRETVVDDAPLVTGLIPIGDARCHTNPTFAFGLSLSLGHAVALAETADTATDDKALATTFHERVGSDAAARFAAVSAEDRDRVRLWSGERIDPTDRQQTMPLYLRSVVYRAAPQDPRLLRAVCRRINLLDPIDALPSDAELLDRAEALFKQLPSAVPTRRDRLLAALRG
ncbi:MAG TPA: FAD-dependent oxidoreductase [Jatrophihabitans sp.]|nr:FAD-dependent oxidoreductase [Jatrophihabitans sp.]